MKLMLKHLVIFAVITLALFAYKLLDISCPIRSIFHFPCPTCGMTRSLIALLNLDIKSYLYYNPTTVPFLIAAFLAFHRNLFKKHKKIVDITVIAVSVIIFIVYVYRLYYNLIP